MKPIKQVEQVKQKWGGLSKTAKRTTKVGGIAGSISAVLLLVQQVGADRLIATNEEVDNAIAVVVEQHKKDVKNIHDDEDVIKEDFYTKAISDTRKDWRANQRVQQGVRNRGDEVPDYLLEEQQTLEDDIEDYKRKRDMVIQHADEGDG